MNYAYHILVHYATTPDDLAKILAKGTSHMTSVMGVLLFYARTNDGTLLLAPNSICTVRANLTGHTRQKSQ